MSMRATILAALWAHVIRALYYRPRAATTGHAFVTFRESRPCPFVRHNCSIRERTIWFVDLSSHLIYSWICVQESRVYIIEFRCWTCAAAFSQTFFYNESLIIVLMRSSLNKQSNLWIYNNQFTWIETSLRLLRLRAPRLSGWCRGLLPARIDWGCPGARPPI